MRRTRVTVSLLAAVGLCGWTPGPGAGRNAGGRPDRSRRRRSSRRTPGQASSQAPGGRRLLSLDFKDADVLNVLRILHAESGQNIVMGPDVKGRVSLSLRNVTWEQALDSVLEAGGLAKIQREGIIRIVTIDQLTREREAQLRAEEARRKAEIEVRLPARRGPA